MTKRKFILIKFIPSKISENALLAVQKDQKVRLKNVRLFNWKLFAVPKKAKGRRKSKKSSRMQGHKNRSKVEPVQILKQKNA